MADAPTPLHSRSAGAGTSGDRVRADQLLALIAELSAAATPAAVIHAVLHSGLRVVGASVAYIGVVSSERESLEMLGQVGLPEAVSRRWLRVPIGEDVPVCAVARSGQPLFFDMHADVLASHPDVQRYYEEVPEFGGALAALPLLGREGVGGTLAFRYHTDFRFDDQIRSLLLALAGLAAQALDRVRLLALAERERERANAAADQVGRLQAVSDALGTHLSLDALLPQALARLRAALDADLAVVTLLEADGTHLCVRASTGIDLTEFTDLRIPLGQGFAGIVAAEGRSWVVPDSGKISVVGSVLGRHGIVGLAGVPLRIDGRVFGTITIGTKRPRELTPAELDLLEQAATLVAVAIERSQAHEELRRKKNEFESLVEHSPDVIARFDRAHRHVYVNRTMVTASRGRMTPEMLIGKTQAELGIPTPTQELTRRTIERVFRTGEPERFSFESVTLWAPGHVDILAVPEFAQDGRTVEYVLLVARDVTALRHAMDELAWSEARLRATLRALNTINWQYDPEANEAWHSEGAHALLGLDPSTGPVTMAAWANVVASEDRAAAIGAMRRALEMQSDFEVTYRICPPGGGERWMCSRGGFTRLPDERGVERPFVLGTTTDVTDQRRATDALQAAEARYRSLFESEFLGVGVWRGSARTGGRIVEANDALLALLGYTREEFEAGLLTSERISPPEENAPDVRAFQELRTVGRCTPYEHAYRAKDGTRVPVLVGSVLVRPDDVAPADVPEDDLEVVFYLLDMRELKTARERLSEGQRLEAVGRLAGGIAHDFNNLLVAMQGFTTFAERSLRQSGLPASHPALGDLNEAQRAAERAATLTRQLLAFSRRQVLQPTRQDLREVIRGFERVLRQALGTDKTLVLSWPDEEMAVQVDRGQIEQVLLNLTLNARDAMEPGGTLTMRLRVKSSPDGGERVVLDVEDTGHGMDAATRARAFEPFFTTKELGRGTGLGLAMVYGIVTQSGGELAVDSTPGVGTRFTVAFPRDVSGERFDADQSRGRPSRGTGTILVVDDEPTVREVARRTLDACGYHVVTAEHGGEALALVEAGKVRPDVIVADLMMPVLDGRALGERLARLHPALPVIYVSGYTDEELSQAGRLSSLQWFLQKPWSEELLTSTVRQVLEVSRPTSVPKTPAGDK